MNSEQIQDWLTDLCELWKNCDRKIDNWRRLLSDVAPNTHILINYLNSNFDDIKLVQPIIAQLLALYYRVGVSRCFTLQIAPSLISLYLVALSKRWRNCADVFELFFLAVYNEEILEGGPNSPTVAKRVEEIRIPLFQVPGVLTDPSKLNNTLSDFTKYTNAKNCVQSVVRIGPYPTIDRITAENRYIVLSRIMRSVNNSLSEMALDVICRYLCMSLLTICWNGFSFSESDFRQRLLGSEASTETFSDFSKKSRIPVSSSFLIESLNGVNFALFNGHADMALRALEAIHRRAHFEMFPDVLLVRFFEYAEFLEVSGFLFSSQTNGRCKCYQTNALRSSLSDKKTIRLLFDSLNAR